MDSICSGTLAWRGFVKSSGPFESAIFDGEACAGDGHEGIQAVFTERNRIGGCLNDFSLTRVAQYLQSRGHLSPRAARGSRLR